MVLIDKLIFEKEPAIPF